MMMLIPELYISIPVAITVAFLCDHIGAEEPTILQYYITLERLQRSFAISWSI